MLFAIVVPSILVPTMLAVVDEKARFERDKGNESPIPNDEEEGLRARYRTLRSKAVACGPIDNSLCVWGWVVDRGGSDSGELEKGLALANGKVR